MHHPTLFCEQIEDKAQCCATIDKTGDVCVPAVGAFSHGKACAGASWLATQDQPHINLMAACPAAVDPATGLGVPRAKLPVATGCATLDRVSCCGAIGRAGRCELNTERNAFSAQATTAAAAACATDDEGRAVNQQRRLWADVRRVAIGVPFSYALFPPLLLSFYYYFPFFLFTHYALRLF